MSDYETKLWNNSLVRVTKRGRYHTRSTVYPSASDTNVAMQ